ncbi:uncharacterized protein OCT59_012885 [Rhizophagus irregularis]|uniref:Uncharacterized protein n=1 Tax=Rhizophagus irregularis (strain DAOM 181602 / DAOM 197198 / MUCL 43194) TaxID=747089 RepID=U9URC8_RHIID|nr:hypothetical protein OCT59_012885 [Rhizophagus irregularis]
MLEKGDIDQAAMVRNINIAFSSILFDQSLILLGKTREWELLRGVYNNRFNKITNDKDERKVIFSLWVYCYEELKNKFGEKVREGNQFRKEEGIGKVDKRSRNDILERVNNENKKTKKGDNNEIIRKRNGKNLLK